MSLIANAKNTDEFFPWDLNTILRMYSTSDVDKNVGKDNKNYIYTTAIFRLVKDILNQRSNSSVNPKKQKAVLECFIETMQRKTQSFKIPKFDLADIKFL